MLEQFVNSFKKAVSMEMDAMRARMGPFEVPLGGGDEHEPGDGVHIYGFTVTAAE